MRRFEWIRPALSDRPGLNPFTRQAIVIQATQAQLHFVELTCGANEVTIRSGVVSASTGAPIGEVTIEMKRFSAADESNAFVAEYVEALKRAEFVEKS